jgi:ComF family protein
MQINPSRFLSSILDLLFPATCIICNNNLLTLKDRYICSSCWERCRKIKPPYCWRCGKPISTYPVDSIIPPSELLCSSCQKSKSFFRIARASFIYHDAVKKAISLFKYSGRTEVGKVLGEFAVDYLKNTAEFNNPKLEYDYIIPVPLHPKREKKRGYNQAAILANFISKKLSLSILTGVLVRKKDTVPQTTLRYRQRQENMRDAFGLSSKIKSKLIENKKILLIDDVITTSATVNECAKVLVKLGKVRQVDVYAFARGR